MSVFDISSNTKPLLHLWSLGIEEQFYLIFPLILLVLYKKIKRPIIWLIAFTIISFGLNFFTKNASKAFYLPEYRFWELFSGAIVALLVEKYTKYNTKLVANILSLFGLFFILAASIYFKHELLSQKGISLFIINLLPIIGTIFIIISGSEAFINRKVLSSKPFILLGVISYPLYLWHWPLLSFAYIINGDNLSPFTKILLIIGSLALALITYFFIEKPLKSIHSWKFKTIPLIFIAICVGAVGFVIYLNKGLENRTIMKNMKNANSQLTGPLWKYTQNENCMNRYETTLSKVLPWWFCVLKKDAPPDIILLGNSYANHLYPAFAFNNQLKDLNVLSIGIFGAIFGLEKSNNLNAKKEMNFINNIIKEDSVLKYIIISGLSQHPSDNDINLLIERIKKIKSNNLKIIIFLPHLLITNNIKSCLGRPLKKRSNRCEVSISEWNKLRINFKKLQSSIVLTFPDILFFDPNEIFCNSNMCSSIRDGLPLYRDQYQHLSVYASELVGIEFSKWAKINAPELLK